MSIENWKSSFEDVHKTVSQFMEDPKNLKACEEFSNSIIKTIQNKGTMFSMGNGGSHCEALHFAEEWTGRFEKNRKPIAALALGEATHLSCVGNDFGFEEIFSRQLEALARPGDFVLFLSTSGKSPNLLRAAEVAKKLKLTTTALLGRDGGPLRNLVENPIVVPAQASARIQEVHLQLIHIAIAISEAKLGF